MTSQLPTVLIVEDDAVFRRVMSFTIAHAGTKVESACNGLEGFNRFMQGGIDFLVTDLQMPQSNGIELLERIAAQQDQPRVPSILCTAKGLELDSQALIERFGLVAVMRKPFSPRRLSELILEATARPAPGATPPLRLAEVMSLPVQGSPTGDSGLSQTASFNSGMGIHG